MKAAWDDPRISRGMAAQLRRVESSSILATKTSRLELAFGGPAAMERLRINAPLVGFVMNNALLSSGSTLSISGWKKPAASPKSPCILAEICQRAQTATWHSAIAALGPAIEVADVDHPSDDVEGTLACNIYQRHVILGRNDATRAGGMLDGLSGRVLRSGAEIANTTDLQALTAN